MPAIRLGARGDTWGEPWLAFAFKVQVLEGDLPAAQQLLRDMGLEP